MRPSLPAIAAAMLLLAIDFAHAAEPAKLTIFAAGTLAVPFRRIDELFEQKYPDVAVQPQFGGSVKMAKQITELHQPADILAVADYGVIPAYLFRKNSAPGLARWYVGFARNAVTFVYTAKSKFADEITPENWYEVLSRPGVEIGRSNPDTDPSGYQTIEMLGLAEKLYDKPGLAERILANAPAANIRDTETSLISALQLGEIDYLAIYRSDALQHRFKYLALPAKIDLSDPNFTGFYAQGVAHTRNGELTGKPIVYAATIPDNASERGWAERYLSFLLGPDGQRVLQQNGFGPLQPPLAVNQDQMPAILQPLARPWPGS